MNISYSWLKEYVSFDLEPEKVAEILTFTGLEVEDIEIVEDIPGGLAGVIVAEVVECESHPDSDHLHITKLSVGAEELLQVVCGAPNVAAGQKVLLATVGTKLPTPDGETFKIKKSKIRGVESMGMICAEDELGIGESHDGIMVLPADAVVGTAAKDYLNLGEDVLFTIGLTPNRVDGASHIGVARDLSAYLKLHNLDGEMTLPSVEDFEEGQGAPIALNVEAVDGSPRYLGLKLDNVKVAESPEWLRKRLLSIGLRPINNVVDITNYILNEVGQPLHAFDAAKIEGNEVVVRRAKEGEKIVTLDEVSRDLSTEDLMICNVEKPMCIAGVFGGINSGVTENTTSVFIESAYFNPVSIRKTSKRHGLKTDASFRYERGADINVLHYALKRAALLMQELAGAKVTSAIQESYPEEVAPAKVTINYERIENFIGKKIGKECIDNILESLDFVFETKGEQESEIIVPTYRVDVTRECDVVEEILRIYGYNNIELPTTVHASINTTPKPDPELVRVKACDLLANNGFMECMNNSLTKADYYAKLKTFPAEQLVMLLNPLSTDLNAMRQTLLFNGLENIAYNANRQITDMKFFEYGNVYSYNEKYSESAKLAMFISGKGNSFWKTKLQGGDFFMLKGYLELLMKRFGIDLYKLNCVPAPADIFSEGIAYMAGDKQLAVMGTISPKRLKQFGIKQAVYAAEVSWDMLMKMYRKNVVKYQEIPKFPEVRRDLALLLDESVSYENLRKKAFAVEKKLLKSVDLFDVYRGDKITAGKKQYAISFVFQDLEKTLTDKAIEFMMKKLLEAFQKDFGATLR